MKATGTLYLGKTKPLAAHTLGGVFSLTLLAFDRMNFHQVEPYRITWTGPSAEAFYQAHRERLTPGQPITASLKNLRTFTVGKRGGCEIMAEALSLELTPFSYETARQPMRDKREQLCNAEQAAHPLNLFPSSSTTTPKELSA